MKRIPVVKDVTSQPDVILGYLEISESLLEQLYKAIEDNAPVGLDVRVNKTKKEIQCVSIQALNVFTQIKED